MNEETVVDVLKKARAMVAAEWEIGALREDTLEDGTPAEIELSGATLYGAVVVFDVSAEKMYDASKNQHAPCQAFVLAAYDHAIAMATREANGVG